ncbi:DUF4262 domain-containing protein [Pseudonocardia adelaidensis]|uniref:DUF4262 domain-containing protein n=1 Tax=Pseudonocardia adelaidensis TaxID=648754 RepID=A0ABP9NQH9_9PSEU
MCVFCDDPALTYPEYLARMARLADEYGWAVQGVERERFRPPWAYTVGLTPRGRPELLVTGMPLHRCSELLDAVAPHLLHDEPPAAGERLRLVDGPLVEFVDVENPDVHLLTALALYGPPVRGLQVVWADDRDRWPWERGFRGRRGGQPVLGPRP